ncbi:MAG: cytochrome c oxidase assembly protein [Acidimicrobiales bacterium]
MVVLAAALAVAYVVGVRRLARRGRRWSPTRTAAGCAGFVAIAAAGVVPDRTFLGHMAGHLLLGMVAPLLLALSAPVTLALQAGSTTVSAAVRRALRWRAVGVLANPVVGFVLFGSSIAALYLTPLLELSQRNVVVHVAVHLHLVIAGSLFLWPLVGVDPTPRRTPFGARLLGVLAAVPFHAFLGLALLAATRPVAPEAYPDLADQRRAAALLWASGELLTLAVAAVVFRAWFVADRREAARADRRSLRPNLWSSGG